MRRLLLAAIAASVPALFASTAHATNVTEFPDNGSEQMARGGAWVARASDPLATFYNPAGLAGQETRVTAQMNLSIAHHCFQRVRAAGDPTTKDGADSNGQYPKVCAEDTPFPNPQVGFTYRVNDRLGIGFLPLMAPSAIGAAKWPEFSGTNPAPQRYLLIDSNVVLITPSIGAGYEVMDGLRIGASFQWGIAAKIHFANASAALQDNPDPTSNDVRAQVDAKQLFIPGFTLGALYSPVDTLDIAAWYRWSAPIDAKGDLTTYANYFSPDVANNNTNGVVTTDTSQADCASGKPTVNVCGADKASIKVPVPMEAKLGFRYHKPRVAGTRRSHLRDPLSQDVFDVELDGTWANNSTFDAVQVRFPGDSNGLGTIPINGTPGTAPPNADVPHMFKDVFGVRFGGDYNAIADKLALRAGAFYESKAQDPTYQNIDFIGSQRFGVSFGGTYRIRLGDGEKKSALEVMLGYGHIFTGTQDNSDPKAGGIAALAGSPCKSGSTAAAGGVCSNGVQQYRTAWPVNLGTMSAQINVINVGVSYRF